MPVNYNSVITVIIAKKPIYISDAGCGQRPHILVMHQKLMLC